MTRIRDRSCVHFAAEYSVSSQFVASQKWSRHRWLRKRCIFARVYSDQLRHIYTCSIRFKCKLTKHLTVSLNISAIYKLLHALLLFYVNKFSAHQCAMKSHEVHRSPSMKLTALNSSSLNLVILLCLINCTLVFISLYTFYFALATRVYCYYTVIPLLYRY